jgi:protein-S-isoprenylcysteine O-methyltransferase Ste14
VQLLLDFVVSLLSVLVVLQYGRSLKTHFASPKMPTGTVVISIVVTATTILFLTLVWIETQPLLALLLGLAIQCGGVWLFYMAIRASREARLKMAFDVANPHGLVMTGPYRYLRHPFYTSYLVFWIGWAIATWSAWSMIPLAVITVIYVIAALGEERKFSRTEMADAYADYRRQTGFFWPRLPGVAKG